MIILMGKEFLVICEVFQIADIMFVINTASDDVACKLNSSLVRLNARIGNTIQQLPLKIHKALTRSYRITSLSAVNSNVPHVFELHDSN